MTNLKRFKIFMLVAVMVASVITALIVTGSPLLVMGGLLLVGVFVAAASVQPVNAARPAPASSSSSSGSSCGSAGLVAGSDGGSHGGSDGGSSCGSGCGGGCGS